MTKQQIGVIGLAVMGKNLAFNIESRGYSVSVYNRSSSRTDEMMLEAEGKQVSPRSEEHTSELQSRGHLVCRLLLERKNRHDGERGRLRADGPDRARPVA